MRYEDAVAEGRRLVKRSEADQWRLAELTWEQVEAGKSMRQWARDIGVSYSHVNALYHVWDKLINDHLGDQRPTFADVYNIVRGRAAQVEEHGSQYAAEARAAVRNMPPEKKAQVARELLAEPEVADKLAVDGEATRALDQAYIRIRKVSEDKLRQALSRVPESIRNETLGAPTGVTQHLTNIREELRIIHEMLMNPRIDWSGYRNAVSDELDQLGNQAKILAELAKDPSKATFTDEDLEQLLGGRS